MADGGKQVGAVGGAVAAIGLMFARGAAHLAPVAATVGKTALVAEGVAQIAPRVGRAALVGEASHLGAPAGRLAGEGALVGEAAARGAGAEGRLGARLAGPTGGLAEREVPLLAMAESEHSWGQMLLEKGFDVVQNVTVFDDDDGDEGPGARADGGAAATILRGLGADGALPVQAPALLVAIPPPVAAGFVRDGAAAIRLGALGRSLPAGERLAAGDPAGLRAAIEAGRGHVPLVLVGYTKPGEQGIVLPSGQFVSDEALLHACAAAEASCLVVSCDGLSARADAALCPERARKLAAQATRAAGPGPERGWIEAFLGARSADPINADLSLARVARGPEGALVIVRSRPVARRLFE